MKKLSIFLLSFLFSAQAVVAQQKPDFVEFINDQHAWVDSVFNSLSPTERIAQLFLVRAHTNLGNKYIDSVQRVIEQEKLGGLVVFQGGPVRHVDMFNRYQAASDVPLLITFDGEWGLGMRLADSTVSFPYQMTLGAIQQDELLYEMGQQIAKELLRMGMHFNFAPVVDINNNPKNPVIGFRSFGDNKENVTKKAKAYMDGMVDGGIIASLKHFPGHGDTDVDSHYDLPQLDFSKRRLNRLEIFPFRELIKAGAPAVMVAHMHIPALDDTPNIPSSISKKVVTDLLRDELGFRGLAVTDAMDMNGVKKFFPDGEADIMAIEAGHDLLEISENSGRAIKLVEKAVQDGRLQQDELDRRVKKVLASKYWLGLDNYQPIPTHNLYEDLNSVESKLLVQRLADASVTVLRSRRGIDNFKSENPTLVISVGITEPQLVEQTLSEKLSNAKQIYVKGDESAEQLVEILQESANYDQIVLAVHDNRSRPRSELALGDDVKRFVKQIARRKTITIMNTNPYALTSVDVSRSGSVIMAYQNEEFMQEAAVKVLLKQIIPNGKLPVRVSRKYRYGEGR